MRYGLLIVVTACLLAGLMPHAATAAASTGKRSAVLRDIESYAIASCLVGQEEAYLKDQGDGWASAIVQRGKGDLRAFAAVAAAVKAELAKGEMAVIHTESGPMADKRLPVMYCGEIVDAPAVRAVISHAVAKLAPDYRR